MSPVLETHQAPVLCETPVSAEVREAALAQALAEEAADGWQPETDPDVERVLVGRSTFRRTLVRRRWGIRNQRQLVDVDEHGTLSVRRV